MKKSAVGWEKPGKYVFLTLDAVLLGKEPLASLGSAWS